MQKTKTTHSRFNPLYWSLPVSIGLGVLGGGIYHASMTARNYLPEVAQTRESLNAATKAALAATQQIHDLPKTANEGGKEAAKGALAGVGDTAARAGIAVAVAPVAVPGTIVAEGLKKISPQNEDALNNLEKNLNPFKWSW
jgi:hypothetical protein